MLKLHSAGRKKERFFKAEFSLQKVLKAVWCFKNISLVFQSQIWTQHLAKQIAMLIIDVLIRFPWYCAALANTNWLLFYIYSVASMPSPSAS